MIKIVTDSTAYMTKEYADKHDIKIVPLTIITKSTSYLEGMPGSFDGIFESMLNDGDTSKSSQPAPETFKEAYDKILKDGNEVLCITISSALSGTYNSARLAADDMIQKDNISVVDSRGCAQLMLLCIEEAVELIEKGKSRAEIELAIIDMMKVSSEIFVPVTLKHLIRGGRIGGVSAVIGSLLHVKPMLTFSNGVLYGKRKIIGMNKAVRELVLEIPKTVRKIYVMQIYRSDFFLPLLEKVKEAFPHIAIKKGEIGPVVGVHVGPGTIGIAYC